MTAIPEVPPAFYLIGAAVLLPFLPRLARNVITVLTPLVALLLLLQYEHGVHLQTSFAGFELILLRVDSVNFIFGVAFLLIAAVAALYAWHVQDTGQQVAATLYTAGTLGVTFAGDFLTLLIFWECMAVASSWLVFARRSAESTRAGFRYLLVHFAGGSALFAGILVLYFQTGSLAIGPLSPDLGMATWLIFLGVAVNLALPPFHAWMPDAYPKATVTGAIFMSALTTKSALYVLMQLFAGWDFLLYYGLVMTLYGIFYAVLANDIRGVLAYHIISQVGYMVVGVGIGSALALNGAAAHAFNNILYKTLLFMAAGAVLQATGFTKLTDLGGLAPKMRAVLWLFLIGSFSISGFPLFNGFVSKGIILSATGKAHHEIALLLLLLASVGTFLSIGLKITAFAFCGKDRGLEVRPLPWNMYTAMGLIAFLCILFGVVPGLINPLLPHVVPFNPYTAYHLIEAVQLLTFTFFAFWLLRHKLTGKPYIALDTDWIYRRTPRLVWQCTVEPINVFFDGAVRLRQAIVAAIVSRFGNPRAWFTPGQKSSDAFDPDAERGPLGNTIAFVLVFFIVLAFLIIQ